MSSPGDRVASLMPSRCEVIVFYIACMKAGLVAVPLNLQVALVDAGAASGYSLSNGLELLIGP